MGATIERLRDEMNVKPTAQDKGLVLTITVTAYDNGMIAVNGTPINCQPTYDQGQGWLGAAEVILSTMGEFRKVVGARRRKRARKNG